MNYFFNQRPPIEERDDQKYRVGFGNMEMRRAIRRVYASTGGGENGMNAVWNMVHESGEEEEGNAEDEEDYEED